MGDNRKLCFEELDLTRRKVNSDCENWLRALESLKTAVKGLIETRNLSGDTKDNISSYLQLFYGQTITALEEAIRHHDAAFSAYVSEYESNNMGGSTVIHTEELEEAKEQLAKTIPKFTSVHKSAKSTKDSVSAIVAGLPSGNTKTYDEPKEEIQTQIIDWTLNKISSIEMGNFEGASSPVIEQVRAMIKNNSAKSVSVRMIQFNPSDFNSSKDVKALTDARNKLRECDENNKEKYDAARKKYDIVDPVERDVKAGTETVDAAAEQGVNDVVNGDEEEALLDENAVGDGESSPVSGGSYSPSGSHSDSDSSNSFRSSTSDEETSDFKNDTKDVSQVDTAEVKSKVTPVVPPVTPSDTTPGDTSEKDEIKQFISPDKDPSVTTPTDTTPVKNDPSDPKPADTSQEATDGTKPYVSPDKDPSASDPKPADTSQEATDGTKPYVSPDKDPSSSDLKPADTSQEATDSTKPYVSPDKGTTDVAVSDGETSEGSSGTTSLEKPVETSQDTHTETPVETPQETHTETPVETPQDTHTETPVETPQETHTEAPAETPQETHEATIISEEMSSGEESGSTPLEKPVESSQEPQIATPAETPTESGDGSTTPVGESSNQEKTEATYSFVDDEELLKKLV